MNINHIVIILLVVILLFMTFAPRPLSYTFRRSPYRKCEYGEVGCDPDSWTPEHYHRHKGRRARSPWEKEVRHRMRHRRRDERHQRRSNRRHRRRESLVEGLASAGAPAPGADDTLSGASFNPNCPSPVPNPPPQVPPPPGGSGQGPPYLSYDCQGGYCTQVPRATGTYWTSDCDGVCKPAPPPGGGGYPDNVYPPRGPPPPPGPQYCPP